MLAMQKIGLRREEALDLDQVLERNLEEERKMVQAKGLALVQGRGWEQEEQRQTVRG